MLVIKRNGKQAEFDASRISNAIRKANAEVEPLHQMNEAQIEAIASKIEKEAAALDRPLTVEEIQDKVVIGIQEMRAYEVATCYTTYRFKRELARRQNTTDDDILKLIQNQNKEMTEENSNKNTVLASTQRDYIAGIVSRDLTSRVLLPEEIAKAHEEGILHFHDMDYFIQPITNCLLVNLGDMLDNGIVMNGKMIEPPKGFQVACTVTTQIVANIASNQYGGQSFDTVHLGKYVGKSREKIKKRLANTIGDSVSQEVLDKLTEAEVRAEVKNGIQTIQYQINTLMTTNGQSPFVTIFMYLRDDDPYLEDNALIIEEILKQRIQGIKNESGVYVTPAFPKLVYVLDENNCLKGGRFDYLTRLAAKCTAKRMYPDYISAKKMRENYEGNVFSPMGCVDGSEVVTYKLHNVQYTESFVRMWDRLADYYDVKVQPNGKDLYMDTDGVMIYDHNVGFVKNYRIIRNLSSDWLRLKFNNGRTLLCTNDHPFETENRGVVFARDLQPEDQISIDHGYASNHNDTGIHFNTDRAWLLGMLLCDSSYYESIMISIDASGEDEIEDAVKHIFKKEYGFDVVTAERFRGKKGHYKDLKVQLNGSKESLLMKNRFVSLFGGNAKIDRHIPNEVFTWDYESRLAFMAGMLDADGYINNTGKITRVQIGSTNKELALQQMYLAQSLGFSASVYLNRYKPRAQHAIRYRVEFIPSQELVDHMVCQKKKDHMGNIERTNDSFATKHYTTLSEIHVIPGEAYSYDVTTESEHFTVSGIWSHNCRSFLSPWKDEDGNYKFEGRFNQGVVSINLPQIGLAVGGDMEKFWPEFDRRLELCKKALMCRHKALLGVTSDVSPLHWQYGALARLKKGEKIDKLLFGGYSSISLGYIGIYELTILMTGKSHTTPEGKEFALSVMHHLKDTAAKWREETNIGFALYGTPAESLCYRFARIDQKKYGDVKDVTDKGYYTNSYHVDVREPIDAFSKLSFEAEFQPLSTGGCISYAEIPNMQHNLEALETVVAYIYDNIQYAEFNTKSDYCHECGFDGEIKIVEDAEGNLVWECPNCGNRNQKTMTVVRRTCGYLGENYWNVGKTKELNSRVLHL